MPKGERERTGLGAKCLCPNTSVRNAPGSNSRPSYPTVIEISNANWEPGISDGLILPCGVCNCRVSFDYNIDNEFWKLVMGDHPHRLGVICLPCFDNLAFDKGYDVSTHLLRVQFTGIGKTIELKPSRLFQYQSSTPSTKGEVNRW